MTPKNRFCEYSATIAGDVIQVRHYQYPIRVGGTRNDSIDENGVLEDRKEEYLRRTMLRQKNAIVLLSAANFRAHDSKFLTLTFRDTQDFDITDLNVCNFYLRKFFRRLKYLFGVDIKYISVAEYQKRGAVHYHVLINLPYFRKSELENLWGHGFVSISSISDSRHMASYLSKYLMKQLKPGEKRVITSRKLDRPTVVYGSEALFLYMKLSSSGYKPVFWSKYRTEFNGEVNFLEFRK